jgi:hypothetical protein
MLRFSFRERTPSNSRVMMHVPTNITVIVREAPVGANEEQVSRDKA